MKHWNYRIIEFATHEGEPAWRELREVYYDDSGRPRAYGAVAQVAWNADEDPATPYSIVARMRAALDKPILDAQDFGAEEPSGCKPESASFTVVLEQDPDSEDVLLPLPQFLINDEDWRIDDRVRLEIAADRRIVLTNLSKIERDS